MAGSLSENEFTKHHKYEEKDIDCYLSKAYDEETEKHFLIASIPRIPELNAMHIQYPMVFDNEAERNQFYDDYNPLDFLEFLLAQMTEQIEKAKRDAEETKTEDITTETYSLQEIAELSQGKEEQKPE